MIPEFCSLTYQIQSIFISRRSNLLRWTWGTLSADRDPRYKKPEDVTRQAGAARCAAASDRIFEDFFLGGKAVLVFSEFPLNGVRPQKEGKREAIFGIYRRSRVGERRDILRNFRANAAEISELFEII